MLKVLAVLRTLFLVFLVGYTLRALPWAVGLPVGSAQAYDVCRQSLGLLRWAAFLAIGWIAFETLVGWWLATRRPKLPRDAKVGPGAPPFAPPPHG